MYRGHENDSTAELESQFILRLPSEPAKVLREAIRNNSTLKDRITIKIENDMRHGEVRVDHWLMTGKVVDLPTVVESLKTIDSKGFYKTADICQMLLCREDDDTTTTTTATTATTTATTTSVANNATSAVATATTNTATNVAFNSPFNSTFNSPFNTAFSNAFSTFFNNAFNTGSNTAHNIIPNITPNITSHTTNTTSNTTPNTTNNTTNTTTTTTTTTVEEDTPQKKKKDPNKVEKKFLWPHGITPPTKNVRRRRFRKTLKKKYVEAPEIEKEVKRLFKSDNEAVSVKWEVINEDDENKINKGMVIKKDSNNGNKNVAEHDIFGGAVSDSEEEEDTAVNVLELDENSQNSAEDSHLTDSNSIMNTSADSKILTEFSSDMFREIENSPTLLQEMEYYQQHQHSIISYTTQNLTKANIETRLEELDVELAIIKNRRQQQECKLETIENLTLRQRFQNILDRLYQEQLDKEQEKYELFELLKQAN